MLPKAPEQEASDDKVNGQSLIDGQTLQAA
jgi:hypothetical protein